MSAPRNRQRRFGCPQRDRRMYLCKCDGKMTKIIRFWWDTIQQMLEMGTNLFSQIPRWMAFVSVRSTEDSSQYNDQCLWRFSIYLRGALSCLVTQWKSDEMRVKIYCELCFDVLRCDPMQKRSLQYTFLYVWLFFFRYIEYSILCNHVFRMQTLFLTSCKQTK